MEKDYYQTLEIDEKADEKKIRDAFRKLALQYHPDRNRDNPDAAAKMKEINEAYAVLSDPEKRKQYDALKQAYGSGAYDHFKQSYTEHDIFRGSDINQILNEISRAFGFRNFDEIFRDFYGAGSENFEFRSNDTSGKGFFYSYGTGNASRPGSFLSKGIGKLIKYGLKKSLGMELPERGKNLFDKISIPENLALKGGKVKYTCRKVPKELMVKIPAGIKEGQQIRLKGMGLEGKGGGQPGDLLVKIKLKKPFYKKMKNFLENLER
ncbi:DnaJ domain-containing protein [Thermodesulfobacteriota bacterium]